MQSGERSAAQCIERGCPFPAILGRRCRQHARDLMSEASPIGGTESYNRDYGLTAAPEYEPRAKGCRSHRGVKTTIPNEHGRPSRPRHRT